MTERCFHSSCFPSSCRRSSLTQLSSRIEPAVASPHLCCVPSFLRHFAYTCVHISCIFIRNHEVAGTMRRPNCEGTEGAYCKVMRGIARKRFHENQWPPALSVQPPLLSEAQWALGEVLNWVSSLFCPLHTACFRLAHWVLFPRLRGVVVDTLVPESPSPCSLCPQK